MTRKQLAEAIYDMKNANGEIRYSTKQSWVKGMLNGFGSSKPCSKQYLTDWYNRMVSEA